MPSVPATVAITGGSDYLRTLVSHELAADAAVERVLVVDARELHRQAFHGVEAALLLGLEPADEADGAEGSDAAAFASARQFLEACAEARVRRVLVASSTTAYGAWADNPVPIPEEQWVRADQPSPGGRQKAILEGLCRQFAEHQAHTATIVMRLSAVLGPRLREHAAQRLGRGLFVLPDGADPPMQVLHEHDLGRAVAELLRRGSAGTYNVGGDGTVRPSEVAALFGRRAIAVPASAVRSPVATARLFGLDGGAGGVAFLQHPFVADNRRLKATLGFEFLHTSRSAVAELARSLGTA